jgi:hypothetical protein
LIIKPRRFLRGFLFDIERYKLHLSYKNKKSMKKSLLNLKLLMMNIFIIGITATTYGQINVLVCGSPSTASWINDVQQKIQATSMFNNVDVFNTTTGTPTLAFLLGYDAVLTFTDSSPMSPNNLGDTLAQYIDLGGGVVNSVFANASVPIGGNFNTTTYQVAVPAGQTQNIVLTLGTILDQCHPTIQAVNNFNGGTSSYKSTSTTFTTGSVVIANWSDNSWLVAVKENVGPANARRADLNFYPPSSDARADFWVSNTQGGLLMAQALLWVAGETTPNVLSASSVVVDASCNGDSNGEIDLSVSGGTPSYTYSWTDGGAFSSTDEDLTGLSAGTYEVTITDDNNCVSVHTVTVNEPTTLSASATTTDETMGNDGTIDLTVTGGTAPYTFSWTDGGAFSSTDEDLTGLSAGTYEVTITDDNGCTTTIQVVVSSVVGITELAVGKFEVYPNPSNSIINIEVSSNGILEMYNANGQLISSERIVAGKVVRDVNLLATGVYTIRFVTEQGVAVKRLVVNK